MWDVVGGNETTPPLVTNPMALHKWKVKARKTMFMIKTMVKEEMLEHMRKGMTPKKAWGTFMTLFTKTNDIQLQLLENELMLVVQGDMMVN